MKKDLLEKLKHQRFTNNDRLAFKNLVSQLENKTHKISKPGIKILKNHGKTCISKYIRAVNEKNKFRLTKKRTNYLKKWLKRCKNKELVIFVHIKNKVTGNNHLNLLIVKGKKVTRIDPTNPKKTKITNKKVKKELIPFFKKFGLNFVGYDHRSKFINHEKLCRYAAPAEYIYGRKLNHRILKKVIIDYFSNK